MKHFIFWDITSRSLNKSQPTFRRRMTPPSSGSQNKTKKKPAKAGGEPVKVITTNIPVNRMARRLEGNIGEVSCRGESNSSRVMLGGASGN
jgi:hypothetical protein